MRLQVSSSICLVALAALVLCAGTPAHAQAAPAQSTGNGAYMRIDPLANVRYDNRFDVSLGAAYGHQKAGPPPLQEWSNLGGLDHTGSWGFSRRLAVEGTGRAYLGSSGAGINDLGIKGPFVSQYMFAAGPEWLGPHNKHGALLVHALMGGARFDSHLGQNSAQNVQYVSFFNNQIGPAAIIGGHIDLNRSARWVFRITPDAMYTRYGINYGNMATYGYWNFGISVGVEYKFKKTR